MPSSNPRSSLAASAPLTAWRNLAPKRNQNTPIFIKRDQNLLFTLRKTCLTHVTDKYSLLEGDLPLKTEMFVFQKPPRTIFYLFISVSLSAFVWKNGRRYKWTHTRGRYLLWRYDPLSYKLVSEKKESKNHFCKNLCKNLWNENYFCIFLWEFLYLCISCSKSSLTDTRAVFTLLAEFRQQEKMRTV